MALDDVKFLLWFYVFGVCLFELKSILNFFFKLLCVFRFYGSFRLHCKFINLTLNFARF